MVSCQLLFLVLAAMVATHGVSGKLRGLNLERNNRHRPRRPHRESLRDMPLRDPSGKKHPRDTRVQREALMRHLREKIMAAEDGHLKQRMRSQLAFLYELPLDDADEDEIESMLARINADDRNKHDHQLLVRALAKFIKRSKRKHRVQAEPIFVPHVPKFDGKAIAEALRKKAEKALASLKPTKKNQDASMPSNMHGINHDPLKLKARPAVFDRKPLNGGAPGGEKRKPIMHNPFSHLKLNLPKETIEAAKKHAQAQEEKAKAVREAILEEHKKSAAGVSIQEAIKSATENVQKHARRLSMQEEKQELKMEMKQMAELRKKIVRASDQRRREMLKEKMKGLHDMIRGHKNAIKKAIEDAHKLTIQHATH